MKAGSWSFSGSGLTVWSRCDQGARRRIEDAWVVDLDARLGPRRVAAFAVFDGLGGEPKGDVAARTASTRLSSILAGCESIEQVLPRLNDAVQTEGGFTTAVVAVVGAGGEVDIASVGDSGAFMRVGDAVRLVTERDSAPDGAITDYLGNPRLRGHVTKARLVPGGSLVLCTDGVDGIVGVGSLAELLGSSGDDVREALERLYAGIHALGAPDNATLVWIRRD